MGTRSIVCIYHNGRFVYAQTGRGDGFPEGVGLMILRWLLAQGNVQRLLEKIHLVQPPASHDETYENWFISIEDIAKSSGPIEHVCNLGFASEGLWCEWAYVLDLDVGVLEVYEGDDRFRGPMAGRFAEAGVVQQVLKAGFSFADLPGFEDEFVQACRRDDGPTFPGGWRLPEAVGTGLYVRQTAFPETVETNANTRQTAQDGLWEASDEGENDSELDEENYLSTTSTRHLICIFHNGHFIIAQYGQHDGFPEITGLTVLRFLTPANIQRLRARIHLVPPPMPSNVDRDSSAVSILKKIASATRKVRHSFQLGFASNGGMCAWCYVVDLDAGALEVYRGRSVGRIPRRPPPYRSVGVVGAGRFVEAGVTQQELQAVFAFDDLPGDEDAFMAACGGVRGADGYFDWSL